MQRIIPPGLLRAFTLQFLFINGLCSSAQGKERLFQWLSQRALRLGKDETLVFFKELHPQTMENM